MKKIIFTVIFLILLSGCAVSREKSLQDVLESNFGFSLPDGFEVVYDVSNRGGFNGDGSTYTVIRYQHPLPDMIFEWTYTEDNASYAVSGKDRLAAELCDLLKVPEEQYKAPSEGDVLQMYDMNGSMDDQLLIWHVRGDDRLYILQDYS